MNDQNDQLRYAYRVHLNGADGYSTKSIDAVLRHIVEYEAFIKYRDFRYLTKEEVTAFRDYVLERPSQAKGGELSSRSIVQTLAHLKAFFLWLANKPAFRRMDRAAIDYFRPPRRTEVTARTGPDQPIPSPDDIRKMIAALPADTMIERRNRALVAFIYLTGMRDGAVISIRCKHILLEARQVNQDAREVHTKFGKNMLTTWFPVGDDIEQIVVNWVKERLTRGAEPDDPLFPATPSAVPPLAPASGDVFWKTTGPVREIFRQACQAAEIRYFPPHLFRKTLARLGEKMCRTPGGIQSVEPEPRAPQSVYNLRALRPGRHGPTAWTHPGTCLTEWAKRARARADRPVPRGVAGNTERNHDAGREVTDRACSSSRLAKLGRLCRGGSPPSPPGSIATRLPY
ncbi:MAG: tyrosine-type recombinase/integrase [Candidatus Kaistia colombiensis]|nr:MAG: tyrosine-type recombinase/integrase [Kaistia sp.]